ncbi:MAG TPA: preprotein translocase subunit SecY [Brevefilum sp.]|nr:preprotein translocase subunit SecY [Brevefilum sp.]HOR19989.1 preprotein translocase subunit SecY [Brevefilum sp.]HPL68797.1 preprotein translocase subunit SecY [Brevefilum sp.]
MKRSAWRYLWKSKDIRRKLLISLALLAIYRFASNVPVPGINRELVSQLTQTSGAAGGLINLLDMLSGGAVSNFSVLAMGVYPYITAQIILQLLIPIIPALEKKMQDDPREGRAWMEKWTMILTIPMAVLSAIGQINIFNAILGQSVAARFGFSGDVLIPTLATLLSMIAGTMFGVWLGELISEFGIRGQGLSLIIFSGIVSSLPRNLVALITDPTWWWLIFIVVALLVVTIYAIVYVQEGRRHVPVMFPGRRVGSRMSMPVKSTVPLMVNMAGMIPIIFAQSLMTFPTILASFFVNSKTKWVQNLALGIQNVLGGQGVIYPILFFVMVVLFTFFYTDILFAQQNYGENLKKQGAQIPGVARGAPTQRYLTKVQRRITLPGALFLGVVAALPFALGLLLPSDLQTTQIFLVSSSGLLIVVGVVRDTFSIIESDLKSHGYDDRLIS